jgi:hypothetical protein
MGRTIMEDGCSGAGDFGYYDCSSASIEATGYANDAWAADGCWCCVTNVAR